MLGVLVTILTVILVFVSLLMSLVILMQRPKQEGLGAAFGGGLTDRMLGSGTTDFLQKATVFMGVTFFVLSLTIATLMAYDRSAERDSQSQEVLQAATNEEPDADPTGTAPPVGSPSDPQSTAPPDFEIQPGNLTLPGAESAPEEEDPSNADAPAEDAEPAPEEDAPSNADAPAEDTPAEDAPGEPSTGDDEQAAVNESNADEERAAATENEDPENPDEPSTPQD